MLKKTLESPLDSKQIKSVNPEYSLEVLVLKLMLGNIESKRRGQQRMSWLDSITNSTDMNLSKLQETVKDRGAWRTVGHRVADSQAQLSD